MTYRAAPRHILDITRLVARAGSAPLTGIDRVERAYLRALNLQEDRFYLACRTALGWLMADGSIAAQLLQWIDHPDSLPVPALIDRLIAWPRQTPALEAALRVAAVARLRPGALAGWLRSHCPQGGCWISVGHMNLNDPTLAAVRQVGLDPVVMVHDTIPLDHPGWSGKDAPARHLAAVQATVRHARLILCPSQSTAEGLRCHATGVLPQVLVAALGVEKPAADAALLPAAFGPTHACFVAVGTIEPRKNIGLLLDVWDGFLRNLPAAAIPHLHLVGRPGWGCDSLLARLRHLSGTNGTIFHHQDLADGGVAALLDRATALLAPSRAEGFGLPPAEAAARGIPVLATDLAVTRAVLGEYPQYLGADDNQGWSDAILASATFPRKNPPLALADWTAHFNMVFNHLR